MDTEQEMPNHTAKKRVPTGVVPQKLRHHKLLRWCLALVVLGMLVAAAAYQYRQNSRFYHLLLKQEKGLQQSQGESRTVIDARLSAATARIDALEKTIQSLSALYQQSTDQREIQRVLADIEHMLGLASESLYLTNDVAAALKLLQYADKKIQGASQPELVKVRVALQRDIQTLSTLPQVDMVREMARIDAVLNSIDQLPLNIDSQRILTPSKPAVATDSTHSWWERLGQSVWHEMKALVSIRRLDKPEQALLTIDQIMLLRENIKLRMLSARIALMTRNQLAYTADLRAVQHYLRDYFDQGQSATQQAADLLQKLSTVQLVSAKPYFTALDVLRGAPVPALKEGAHG